MRISKIDGFAQGLIVIPNLVAKPLHTVLRWQVYATLALTVPAAVWAGPHGAISAALGGAISALAGWAFAYMVARRPVHTPAGTLRVLFRAEASKIIVIIVFLALVLKIYQNVVLAAFFIAFAVSVVLSQATLLVRDN